MSEECAHDHDDDGHGHQHHHGLGHSHAPANFGRAFAIGVILNACFVMVEVIYGLVANSMALLADAGHNLGDVLGLFLAWSATVAARRMPTDRHTYGLRRMSILAALSNAILLLVSVGVIAWEAIGRLREPVPVETHTIIGVSLLGIFINLATAFMFMSGRKGDLNVRSAFTHMAADAAISGGVVVAGFVIMFTGWVWLDPIVSLVLALVIVAGTWSLLRGATNLALDAVPEGIDLPTVQSYLEHLPGVTDAHHLHIWGLSTTESALSVHLVLAEGNDGSSLLNEVHHELEEKFGIGHATVQFEFSHYAECAAKNCS